jgi:hypothetical protein
LSDITSKIPGRAKELGTVRRLSRFLANSAVRVREWYTPVARNLLRSVALTAGDIRLIADGTKVGFNHQLLMIAIAWRRRALPIAWTWVRCQGAQQCPKAIDLVGLRTEIAPYRRARFSGWRQ